ncbi:MAG: hypothetical protein ACRCW2_08420 [Cellulosilyticaceae bacterium]
MSKYERKDYIDYIDQHKQIMRKRYELCHDVMAQLGTYDEMAYQYAYYLCGLNLEELNYLRYLFGSGIDSFFEQKMFSQQGRYLSVMDQHYWKQRYQRDQCRICLYVSQGERLLTRRLVMPKVFEAVSDQLSELGEALCQLAEAHPELEISRRWYQMYS